MSMKPWMLGRSGGDQYLWNSNIELSSHTSVNIPQLVAQWVPS